VKYQITTCIGCRESETVPLSGMPGRRGQSMFSVHNRTGEYTEEIYVSWTTIKAIYARAVELFVSKRVEGDTNG